MSSPSLSLRSEQSVTSRRKGFRAVCMLGLLSALITLGSGPARAEDDCCAGLPPASNPTAKPPDAKGIRITADPNNLPFSNQQHEGFENKIAELVAAELGVKIEWSWRAQRRGFFRETLKDNNADLVMGAPAGYERALTTSPYYRSSYVFVYRK